MNDVEIVWRKQKRILSGKYRQGILFFRVFLIEKDYEILDNIRKYRKNTRRMGMKLSRREFLKTAAVTGTAAVMLGATGCTADSGKIASSEPGKENDRLSES